MLLGFPALFASSGAAAGGVTAADGTAAGIGAALADGADGSGPYAVTGTAAGIGTAAGDGAGTATVQGTAAGIGTAAAVSGGFTGAIVYPSTDATGQNYSSGSVLSWDTELIDSDGFHTGGDPTKLTVPSAVNGMYGIVTAMVALSSFTDSDEARLEILRGSTLDYNGCGSRAIEGGIGAEGGTEIWIQASTQPILLTTGDIFEAKITSVDTSVTLEAERSSFSIRVLPSLAGALMRKAADQTAANFSANVAITWDTEIYDADAAHDTGSNTTRITVPAGWNGKYGIFRGNARVTSHSSSTLSGLFVFKGASITYDGTGGNIIFNGALTTMDLAVRTQPIPLATGEIYELYISDADTSVTLECENSTFGVEVLDTVQGCLVKKNADQVNANYSTPTALAWDGTDIYDTDAIHDPSSSNTKLIIPSALDGKYVVATCNIVCSANVANNSTGSLKITKNGSTNYVGFGGMVISNGVNTSLQMQCSSQPFQVATGDEIEAVFYCSDTQVTVVAARTSFGLIVVEPA